MLLLSWLIDVFRFWGSKEWSCWVDWARVEELIWVESWSIGWSAVIICWIIITLIKTAQIAMVRLLIEAWIFSVIEVMVKSHEVLFGLRGRNGSNECRCEIFHLGYFLLSDLNFKLTSFEAI